MTPALHKAARNPPECDPTKEDCGCDGGEVTGVVSVAGTTRYALDKASRRTRIDSPAGTFGLDYCARNLLAVLADKPKRPADLRRELGVSSPNYFTSCYLTPLAAAGFIVSEEAPHSPQRTYRLTAKGWRALA